MTISWVIGHTGLLGSALSKALRLGGVELFVPSIRIDWNRIVSLNEQFAICVNQFAECIEEDDCWEIYWSAGIGTMASDESELCAEHIALLALIHNLRNNTRLISKKGCIIYSSSAGAIYSDKYSDAITEYTKENPICTYGYFKLKMEAILGEFIRNSSMVSLIIARVSTLYGPGQSTGKKQGLLSYIARNTINSKPISIYVSFGTIRDYIHCDDAADIIISITRNISYEDRKVIKLIASENPVSIASIISIFQRLSRKNIKVITSQNNKTMLYNNVIKYKSCVYNNLIFKKKRTILIGISELLNVERINHCSNHAN